MIEVFSRYMEMFLHPFKVQRQLAIQRLEGQEQAALFGVSLAEAISVSWVWYMVHGAFTIAMLYITSHVYENLEQDNFWTEMIVDGWMYANIRITILSVLVGIAFFPFYKYIFVKIYRQVTKFFVNLFQLEVNDEAIDQVVSCSLCANALYLIPIFGGFLSFCASGLFLFAGFKNNMRMTSLQSVVTLAAPLLVSLFFLFFMIFIFALMLSALF